jgi:hypothetical protein
MKNPEISKFLEEAVGCFENRYYRSAVILSWVGAMAVLEDYVVANYLKEFNTEVA